jgi:dolichyl-phosphate-mannose-protein mannosyltransferase
LHTRHQQFPFFRHPDEPGKVEQVLKGDWNFHHPMLLLTASKVAVQIFAVPRQEQQIVEAGRSVSAAFTALAVVAFSLLAYLWRGWLAALTTGVVLSLHHQLYELSHYMKEDSALLMGVAFTLLAATWFARRPTSWKAALLGGACALAISGKYVGVVMLAVAVPMLWRARDVNRVRRIGIFCMALVAVFAAVNLPLIANTTTFGKSLAREMDYVVYGQRGMTRNVPHTQYWNVFLDNTTPAIWLLLLLFLGTRWRQRHEVTASEWAVVAFPFLYAVALSFSPKSNDRYFLPGTALFAFLAVLGIEDAAALVGRRAPQRAVVVVLALMLIALQVTGWSRTQPGCWQYDLAFQHDDSEELVTWIGAELPPDAVLATDNRVGLPDARKKKYRTRAAPLPQRILGDRFVADLGSLAELRGQGVTHVIVSESDYGRFFLESLRPQEAEETNFRRRKAFYEELFREGKRLWARPRGTVIYLHPGIEVYWIQ